MLRKLLAATAILGLVAVAAPSSAQADNAAGVVEFIGDATVGEAWAGGPGGDGLCFPTRKNEAGCPAGGALAQAAQEWAFDVSGLDGGQIPSSCRAAGVFPGPVIAVPGTGLNCSFVASGLVMANSLGVGPSCGMSHGTSTDGPADTFSVGTKTYTVYAEWETSAGGSIPLSGTITDTDADPDHTHDLVGFVQLRPLTPGPCVSHPAATFMIVGVLSSAG